MIQKATRFLIRNLEGLRKGHWWDSDYFGWTENVFGAQRYTIPSRCQQAISYHGLQAEIVPVIFTMEEGEPLTNGKEK